MALKKTVVLGLNIKVKLIKASEKEIITVKEIVTKLYGLLNQL
jgi:hypothetical protein